MCVCFTILNISDFVYAWQLQTNYNTNPHLPPNRHLPPTSVLPPTHTRLKQHSYLAWPHLALRVTKFDQRYCGLILLQWIHQLKKFGCTPWVFAVLPPLSLSLAKRDWLLGSVVELLLHLQGALVRITQIWCPKLSYLTCLLLLVWLHQPNKFGYTPKSIVALPPISLW